MRIQFIKNQNSFFSLMIINALAISFGCQALTPHQSGSAITETPAKQHAKVVLIAGKDSHADGEHEHKKGVKLLADCLSSGVPGLEVVTTYDDGWPKDGSIFSGADSVVIYCDGGKRHVMNHNLDTFDGLLEDGVGVVCIHYGVEVEKESESAKRMLDATGGYFEIHYSVNPHWKANFKTLPKHPITRGVKPFSMQDEWYFNMRFRESMEGITPILSAIPPAATMNRKDGAHSGNPIAREMVANKVLQHVGWAYQREDGGRGFGFTGGHFHKNWDNDDFRKIMLNAIVWTTHLEVPADGVPSQVYRGSVVEQTMY